MFGPYSVKEGESEELDMFPGWYFDNDYELPIGPFASYEQCLLAMEE